MWKIVERKRDIFLVWDPDGKSFDSSSIKRKPTNLQAKESSEKWTALANCNWKTQVE